MERMLLTVKKQAKQPVLEEIKVECEDLAQMARLALVGRQQDIQTFIQRLARRYRDSLPDLALRLSDLSREAPTPHSPLRREVTAPLPVDLESRLQLLRIDQHPSLDIEPIWTPEVSAAIKQVISERQRINELTNQGLLPTRSMIFTGAPGVGKSLAARWIARELGRPLLTLDLSAVMSSFLGRTGANVRHVLDYAKSVNCVLLLDELDSIAKRRDDDSDVGELKRLVTVLLQEIDDWPSTGILVAATNHADLLDPAVWRRFELRIEFPMPTEEASRQAVDIFLGPGEVSLQWRKILAITLRNLSFSDIERELMLARRAAVIHGEPLEDTLQRIFKNRLEALDRNERVQIASWLTETGISQRQVHELTNISRDTIRKKTKSNTTTTVS